MEDTGDKIRTLAQSRFIKKMGVYLKQALREGAVDQFFEAAYAQWNIRWPIHMNENHDYDLMKHALTVKNKVCAPFLKVFVY